MLMWGCICFLLLVFVWVFVRLVPLTLALSRPPRASPAVSLRSPRVPLRFAKGTGDHKGRPYGVISLCEGDVCFLTASHL